MSRDMERDFFMSPRSSEYGIIDTVITHRDVATRGGGGLGGSP